MTEPEDLEPNAAELAEQREVRDLLRGEPVDVDPVRREAAIAAALEAAPAPELAHRRARRSGRVLRPVLVAAATVAVVAGGVAALGNLGSGSSADLAGEAETAHQSTASGAGSADDGADAPAPTSTTAPASPEAARGGPPDLGDFEDTSTLLDTAATTLGSVGDVGDDASSGGAPNEEAFSDEDAARLRDAIGLPCLEAAAASRTVPAALARVQGRPVVVALGDGTLAVLDATSCDELARRGA